jgi:hypothetical protein
MGRGHSNLLYGGALNGLRVKNYPPDKARSGSLNVPDYHSPEQRFNLIETVYTSDGKIAEKHYGRKDAEQPFVRHLFNSQGAIVESYYQVPLADYDYINGYYYDQQFNQDQPKEFATDLQPVTKILDKPLLDSNKFTHHPDEWDFPSYIHKAVDGTILKKRYWRYDKLHYNSEKARDPRLGPAEINYHSSGNLKSERYWTACYKDQYMYSTLNNPYGPAEITYYGFLDDNGKPIVKSKKWTRLIPEKRNNLGELLRGFTETGRVDGGPGVQKFDEYGNLICEEYYGLSERLDRKDGAAIIEYDGPTQQIISQQYYNNGQRYHSPT